MSSAKSQVAVATNIPSLSSTQSQKEYSTEEQQPLGRQNSFGNNRRGNMKGKHLTRSVAMREATSPPRTPTPRADHGQASPNGQITNNYQQQQQQQQHHHMDGNDNSNNNISNHNNNSNNKLHAQSNAGRGNSPIIEAPAVIVTSQQQANVALCNEAEFPKLTPPKSTKGGGGGGGGGSGSGGGSGGGQRNNNNNSNNNSSNSNNINGIVDGNNKIEYNNNNNSRKMANNGNTANSGGGGGGGSGNVNSYDSNKSSANSNSNNNSNSGSGNSNANKHQQYNASNALHQALNVGEHTTTTTTARGGGNGSTSLHNSAMNYQLNSNNDQTHHHPHQISYDKENRFPRNDSQNSSGNMSNMHDDEPHQTSPHQQQHQSHHQQQQQHYERQGGGGGGGGGNKKHRTNSNSKGNKPRLKNIGGSSSGSVDGGCGGGGGGGGGNTQSNNTSGFISRENSSEQFTDHGGTDLFSFFKETLNKHPKDRHFLLKVEKDLTEFVQEKSRGELRFPPASSYNRMLIHRTAAFFGMEHNVDTETQQCVIVAATKNTRIPEIRFKSLVRDHRDDTRKSILKRDTHSFDEARQSSYLCPDRGSMLDRKAKSFEEREEDYERARSRIFNRSQNDGSEGGMDDGYMNVGWTQSVEQQQHQQQQPQPQHQQNRSRANGKMMKMQNSNESRDGRAGGGAVPKFNNYGGGGGAQGNGQPMMRGDSANSNKNSGGGGGGGRSFSKQDSAGSTNTTWRLSPSSSGYKTQSQSVHSDSVTPSPNGYCSEDATVEPTPPYTFITAADCMAMEEIYDLHSTPMQLLQQQQQPFLPPPPPNNNNLLICDVADCIYDPMQTAALTPTPLDVGYDDDGDGGGAILPLPADGLVWAVTDIASVPKGSVLINPQTLQPFVNQDGSIYHFDPTNLPPNQQAGGAPYHANQGNNAVHYAQQPSPQHLPQQPIPPPQQQQQMPDINVNRNKAATTHQMPSPSPIESPALTPTPQQQMHCKNLACNEVGVTIPLAESMSESSTQTMAMCGDVNCDGIGMEMPINATEEASPQLCTDECDNTAATGCLSITTTISTKSYDRIEVQKFKNQATSPNIPADKEESVPKRENLSSVENALPPAAITAAAVATAATTTATQASPPSQTPTNSVNAALQRETPHSARSTPFSTSDSTHTKHRSADETKATTWTYTQSYQAPDGSTVFHTTATPSGSPYCTTTYQQGPDGSVYAIPQGMVYATYPPPVEGEVQSYFMPVFDPNQPRTDATTAAAAAAGLIPAGAAQAIYPAGAPATAGSTATMVPVAAAYPTAQFATANGAPIYPGQLIYSSDQFATSAATAATVAAAAAAAAPPPSGQLQQIPMTTYPIGYPYAYNGYWGQPMTYYVPQQALTNAVAATPLLSAQPQPQPQAATATAQTVAGPHIHSGGINIANGALIAAPAAAAGPSLTNSTVVGAMGSGSGSGGGGAGGASHAVGNHGNNASASSTNNGGYQTHIGTTYFGTGRIKRPNSAHHYVNHQSGGGVGAHQLVTATIPTNGGSATTTYQLGHAVPTLTLAAPAQAGGAAAATGLATANTSGDLSAAAGGVVPATTTMYTLPQHAALLHANIFPYAPASAAAAGTPTGVTIGTPPVVHHQHTPGGGAQTVASTQIAAGGVMPTGAAAAHPQQTAVITPFYTHHQHPHMTAATHSTGAHHGGSGGGAVHTPGPAAIPIVDPNTLTAITHTTSTGGGGNSNNATNAYSGGGGSASHSAASTPHSVPTQAASNRNPPLFATPPIMNSSNNNSGDYSGSSTPQYYTVSAGDGNVPLMNSPHGNYVQHDKRNNNNNHNHNTNSGGGKKPPAYPGGNSMNRQNSTTYNGGGSNGGGGGKPPLLANNNDTRTSPNSGSSSGGYQGSRPHGMNKRGGGGVGGGAGGGGDKPQTPLLSGPPSYPGSGPTVSAINNNSSGGYHVHHNNSNNNNSQTDAKPPIRLNAGAPSFRATKSSINYEYRRSASQRNSPGTAHSSSNTSPNSIVGSSGGGGGGANTPNCYANTNTCGGGAYMPAGISLAGGTMIADHQTVASATGAPLYIAPARGAHIPPHTLQHGGMMAAAAAAGGTAAGLAGTQQATTAAVLGGAAAAEVANAAAAAVAATVAHHQPLLSAYQPGASGVYIKYGQTYFAHPSVALPNSRRSPSTDLRPTMAPVAGMYPTMMIQAAPRHAQGRHPNPNYKGTRPR